MNYVYNAKLLQKSCLVCR